MTQHRSHITFCVCAAFAVALFSTLAGVASAEDKRAARTATDQSLFPKALGVLANEKLMFPVDMSNWPVRIDSLTGLSERGSRAIVLTHQRRPSTWA